MQFKRFSINPSRERARSRETIAKLEAKIYELEVEIIWLKMRLETAPTQADRDRIYEVTQTAKAKQSAVRRLVNNTKTK